MKKVKLTMLLMSLVTVFNVNAQKAEIEAIKSVITKFSAAGDANNADKLTMCLDDNYRIVMNQLFGSKDVNVMPKSVYIEKIAAKEFGGDQRKVNIENVTVNGNTACAFVKLEGKKMTTKSFITLVKHADGRWKLVSDMPVVM